MCLSVRLFLLFPHEQVEEYSMTLMDSCCVLDCLENRFEITQNTRTINKVA